MSSARSLTSSDLSAGKRGLSNGTNIDKSISLIRSREATFNERLKLNELQVSNCTNPSDREAIGKRFVLR